ncbi:MAG: flagellar basal body-associated FliL family protein [Syntrophobacteraceae bacterium]|nr:flagellar basal body-associated FliL family protein [Syntrophobacteraceae bacterium]
MSADEDSKEGQEKSKSKLLVIVLVLVVLLLGGGAGAYFMFMKPSGKTETVKKEEKPVSYPMATFIVNLADPGSKRFLKASIDLELDSKEAADECKDKDSKLKDVVLTVLSSQESGDIVTADDKVRLKKMLLKSLNSALTKGKITKIYFTDFLIQ